MGLCVDFEVKIRFNKKGKKNFKVKTRTDLITRTPSLLQVWDLNYN